MAVKSFRDFIQLESSGGIVLFAMAVVALVITNSPLAGYYERLFALPLSLHLGALRLEKPLLLWINDGLMAVFFMLVGLEVKREMLEGELSSINKALLPGIAAVGGMVVPALIYVYLNWGDAAAMRGWAIPMATDIAFSLGILSLFGKRLPVSLKIFLTALAIFDDIGAIVVIAIFYTKDISIWLLAVASVLTLILFTLPRFKITSFGPYIILGALLWLCVLKSGVHATLAGILIAFAIPLKGKTPDASPLKTLENALHPWVAFGILPLFAFANAGVSLLGITKGHFMSPITLGIAGGLLIGKQIGIWGSTMLAIKLKWARMPHQATSLGIYGVSLVAGVGFTMSLFIGSLAFSSTSGAYTLVVKMGVIGGSLLAGLLGYFILRFVCQPTHVGGPHE